MIVLGITGPTGAGKTTALQVLREMGCSVVDCDALYYELLRTDKALRQALEAAFGPVFLPDGSLDRRTLAKRVFSDARELDRLNAIVYPAVSAGVEQKIGNCSQKGLAIDAVNLIESGLGELCCATVAVTAPPEFRLRRIMVRDGLTREQAQARIQAQKPDSWYRERCTFLLENHAEDKAEFERLMGGFFADLLLLLEWRSTNDGCKRVEGKASDQEEKRL